MSRYKISIIIGLLIMPPLTKAGVKSCLEFSGTYRFNLSERVGRCDYSQTIFILPIPLYQNVEDPKHVENIHEAWTTVRNGDIIQITQDECRYLDIAIQRYRTPEFAFGIDLTDIGHWRKIENPTVDYPYFVNDRIRWREDKLVYNRKSRSWPLIEPVFPIPLPVFRVQPRNSDTWTFGRNENGSLEMTGPARRSCTYILKPTN